jgi:tetratricopeptide (TPR) repeat protein
LGILEEFTGSTAYLLWVSFRDAELWARTDFPDGLLRPSTEDRVALIESMATELNPIKPALFTLAALVQPQPRSEVATGCDAIAGWSELQSCLRTAIDYAQVASLTLPTNAAFAVRAARLLRMRAEYARALSWFDHSIYLARATGDWDAYARAHSGLGCLFIQRGNLPRARAALRRSLRVARRHHMAERAASAYHNLFVVEAIAADWVLAEKFARRAMRLYPSDSRGLPRLARDLAFRWIQRGYFDRALPLAREALQHFTAPADRALVWSDIARAAAGAGEPETFEDAWARAWVLVKEAAVDPFAADILLNLAHAAAFRRDASRATISAELAIAIGRSRKEGQVQLEAEAVLASLREPQRDVIPPPPPSEASQFLAGHFVRVLTEARAVA